MGCSITFILKVGVEESIVKAPRITDQLFKYNLTFCVFILQTGEWSVEIDPSTSTLRKNLKEHRYIKTVNLGKSIFMFH
jgi:ribosomal protein L28